MYIATATELQNNFGKYLGFLIEGEQITITKNGKEIGRMIPSNAAISFLTDSLTGILSEYESAESERESSLRSKYALDD